jgi:HPt (histidine-containing phosphotransfer) domain-containing protein
MANSERKILLPRSQAARVEQLSSRRAKVACWLHDEMRAQLHPGHEAQFDADHAKIASEIDAEVAEALARWKDAHRYAGVSPSSRLQRLLELCRRIDQRIDDIEEAETAAEVRRLARCTPAAFDRCKRAVADQLGIDVRTLNKMVEQLRRKLPDPGPAVVPWPFPVDGLALLDEMTKALRRHVMMAEHEARAIALWVAHCHAIDAFSITPRLLVRSVTMRSGKTTLRDVVARLVPRPLCADHSSFATICRATDRHQPTLLLDDMDSATLKESAMLFANSGHRRGGFLHRMVHGKAAAFETFAPMMLAGIGRLPAAVEDRGILVELRRRRPDEACEGFRHDRTDVLDELARRASRWAADHRPRLSAAEPAVPESLSDRAADNWRPLFAIADEAGSEWGRLAREAAQALAPSGNELALSERLLRDIGPILASTNADRLSSEELVSGLVGLEGSPWAEWHGSRPLSKHQLARLLRPFGIQPATIRIGDATAKGYLASQFEDALLRYRS